MKKIKPIIITMLLVTFLCSSYVAIAAEYGSKSDPLVSLSYLEDVVLPQVEDEMVRLIANYNDGYISELKTAIAEVEGSYSSYGSNDEFIQKVADKLDTNRSEVVTVKVGDVISLKAGSEILLRTGSLTSVTSWFLNATTAETLTTNGSFVTNNLYISLENDQEITVVSDATVIIFGAYTIK